MHFLQAINSDISILIVCNKTGGTIKGDKIKDSYCKHADKINSFIIYLFIYLFIYLNIYSLICRPGQRGHNRPATSWTVRRENRVGEGEGEIFRARPDWPQGPPTLLYKECRFSFPGVKRPSNHLPSSSVIQPLGLHGLFQGIAIHSGMTERFSLKRPITNAGICFGFSQSIQVHIGAR